MLTIASGSNGTYRMRNSRLAGAVPDAGYRTPNDAPVLSLAVRIRVVGRHLRQQVACQSRWGCAASACRGLEMATVDLCGHLIPI